jgi:hypothetical protein
MIICSIVHFEKGNKKTAQKQVPMRREVAP